MEEYESKFLKGIFGSHFSPSTFLGPTFIPVHGGEQKKGKQYD